MLLKGTEEIRAREILKMSMESCLKLCNGAKPFVGLILMQFGYAGMGVIAKSALNQGMSHYTLTVYRHAIATLVLAPFALFFDRKVRPPMTISIFAKILLLGLLEPVIDQNLFYKAMKNTTATFSTAMFNVLPAVAFLMAWILRLEKVNIKSLYSQAKVVGTIVTVGGAMLMTLITGPVLEMPWTKGRNHHQSTNAANHQSTIKGSLMIIIGCLCGASFIILQAFTLKSYPAELSLAALICVTGMVEGAILTLAMEWGNASIWSIHWDAKLLAALYSGIIVSGIGYFVQGAIIKERGPVFVTAFNPLNMVFVAIMGSLFLNEQTYLGRVIGSIIIVIGLYLVIWGKSKDERPSKPNGDQAAPNEQQMAVMNSTGTSNHGFHAVDMAKVIPRNEPS